MKRMSSRMDPDELDILIVKELESDARQSTRNVAANIGRLPKTVSNRLQKMVDDKDIGFYALVNPKIIGYRVQVLCGIHIVPGKANAAIREMTNSINVQYVVLTTGRFDMLVYAIFHDYDELLNWKSTELSQMKSIATFEEMIVLKAAKYSYAYLGSETTLYKEIDYLPLEEMDLKMIKLLMLNPREPIGSIAKKVGLTRQTTAIKMKTLLDNKALRLVSIIDPAAFGFSIQVSIFIKTRFDKIISIMHDLVQNARIKHVSVITGHFNIMITTIFKDLETMSDFLNNELGVITGVISYETLIAIGKPVRLTNTHIIK